MELIRVSVYTLNIDAYSIYWNIASHIYRLNWFESKVTQFGICMHLRYYLTSRIIST